MRQWGEKYALAATLARQLETVLKELLDNGQASKFLRKLTAANGDPVFIRVPEIRRGNRKEGGWTAAGLVLIRAAIQQARVDHVCAACHGKGCHACDFAGFSPKNLGQYIIDPQQVIDFEGDAT